MVEGKKEKRTLFFSLYASFSSSALIGGVKGREYEEGKRGNTVNKKKSLHFIICFFLHANIDIHKHELSVASFKLYA
jgi:hypothetical protein